MSILVHNKYWFFDVFLVFQQKEIVIVLSITVFLFLVLLILGLRKTYKLNEENDRLSKQDPLMPTEDEDNHTYKDFTEGHLYSND